MSGRRGTVASSLTRINPGVFFTPPAALPRGRHSLSPEDVRVIQRERILIAVTELLAAGGYRSFGIGEIAEEANVSRGTFYECFDSKDACVFAGYDRFVVVLLARLAEAPNDPDDPGALAGALIGAYVSTLQQDLVAARAYHIEIEAVGAAARARRRDALARFAAHISTRIAEFPPQHTSRHEFSETAHLGAVCAARQLACDAMDSDPHPDLMTLATDLERWITDLFRLD